MKIIAAMFLTAALACGAAAADKKAQARDGWKTRVFTAEELKKNDGREGRPVYVAVDGIVYDLSKSKYWKTGTHMKMHEAGTDQSRDIHERAPKGIHKDGKILEKMPKVGVTEAYAKKAAQENSASGEARYQEKKPAK